MEKITRGNGLFSLILHDIREAEREEKWIEKEYIYKGCRVLVENDSVIDGDGNPYVIVGGMAFDYEWCGPMDGKDGWRNEFFELFDAGNKLIKIHFYIR